LSVCFVIFVCTILSSSGYSFSLTNTGLKQWPHKQHHYHAVYLLGWSTRKIKYCTTLLSRLWRNILHNIMQ